MASAMNTSEKIVFSSTLQKAAWGPTTIIRENMVAAVKKLKQQPGKPLTILGSGSIITQLAEAGLIDSYQFSVHPVAIGNGTSIFKGLQHILNLQLTGTRTFKNGVLLLNYKPA
jgi:dihydrofolate reductase